MNRRRLTALFVYRLLRLVSNRQSENYFSRFQNLLLMHNFLAVGGPQRDFETPSRALSLLKIGVLADRSCFAVGSSVSQHPNSKSCQSPRLSGKCWHDLWFLFIAVFSSRERLPASTKVHDKCRTRCIGLFYLGVFGRNVSSLRSARRESEHGH